MKTLLTTLVLTTAIAGTVNAEAQDRAAYSKQDSFSKSYHRDGFDGQRRDKRGYDDQRYSKRDGKHYNKPHNKHVNKHDRKGWNKGIWGGDKIRLDLPVNFRGDGRLKLKGLARQYHGINLEDYRLVRVVLDSHGRRDGAARLRVGQHTSDLVYLGYGRSVIHAPNVRGNGRWVLKLDDASVSNVRLVLEPRGRHHVYKDKRHHASQDRFPHRAWKNAGVFPRW